MPSLPLYGTICWHGCIKTQINNPGREFVNEVSRVLDNMISTEQRITLAYHPQSTGLSEGQNRTIKEWKSKTRVTSYKFKCTSYQFQFTSYEFESTSFEFKSMSYEFQFMSYLYESTSYEIKSKSQKTKSTRCKIKSTSWKIKSTSQEIKSTS